MTVDTVITSTKGVAALPRANGELVFELPWQARAFGVAVSLVREQGLDWEEFRRRLVDEIGAWEHEHADNLDEWSYYERWLVTLERMVIELGIASWQELDARASRIAEEIAHEHNHLG